MNYIYRTKYIISEQIVDLYYSSADRNKDSK
jgi:hypothetical protein